MRYDVAKETEEEVTMLAAELLNHSTSEDLFQNGKSASSGALLGPKSGRRSICAALLSFNGGGQASALSSPSSPSSL